MYTWVDNITQIYTLYSEFILIKSCLKYFEKYLEISYFELKNKQTKNKQTQLYRSLYLKNKENE